MISSALITVGAPAPSFFEHADVLQILLGCAVLTVCFLTVRTLAKIDENQNNLYKLIGKLQERVYRLEGAHEAFHGKLTPYQANSEDENR